MKKLTKDGIAIYVNISNCIYIQRTLSGDSTVLVWPPNGEDSYLHVEETPEEIFALPTIVNS